MDEFIIASVSETDRFIKYDKNGKMSVTNRRENAARFSNSNKAWRILTTQMPKKKRDGWMVVAYDTKQLVKSVDVTQEKLKVDIDVSLVTKDYFNWETVKKDIASSVSKLIEYKEQLSEKISQIEAELCDCEHACEFFEYGEEFGYKIYLMIRERRMKRRYYKNELWKVNTILNTSCSDMMTKDTEEIFKNINEQVYEPRILKELFRGEVLELNGTET